VRQSSDHDWNAVFVSVEGVEDEDGVIDRILAAFADHPKGMSVVERLAGRVSGIVGRIKKFEISGVGVQLDGVAADWRDAGQRLFKDLSTTKLNWVILVDELPLVVMSLLRKDASGQRARALLSWLRELRGSSRENVRWILAGSIGLDTVARRQRMSDTINDLTPLVGLGPLAEEAADAFIIELGHGKGIEFDPATRQRIIEKAGWLIPYHVQLLVSATADAVLSGWTGTEAVEAGYLELLSPARRTLFDWWHQRLGEELGSEAGYAVKLLTVAARRLEGARESALKAALREAIQDQGSLDELFGFLLDMLQSDGYLVLDGGRYRFLSPLLREFWVRRVV
jgi:hypothetical protein